MSDPTYGSLPTLLDPTAWAGRVTGYSLDVGTIQLQLKAQLDAIFTQFDLNIATYIWPKYDLDTWWNDPNQPPAFVLISYKSSDYSQPKSTSAMLQERKMKFVFHVEARTSVWPNTGPGSVYELVEGIEEAMTGFQPKGCRNGFFTDEEFKEQDPQGRIWLYDMTFNVTTMRQKLPANYLLANCQRMQFNIQPGGDQVIVPPVS